MQNLKNIAHTMVLGNPIYQYVLAIFFYFAILITLKIVEKVIVRRIKILTTGDGHRIGNFLVSNFEKIAIPTGYFAALYFAFSPLIHELNLANVFKSLWVIVLSVQTIKLFLTVTVFFLEGYWHRKNNQPENAFVLKSILGILRLGVWTVGIVFVLDNLGFNVSAVVAGLGITGVAVALAAQTILGDLFNYFVIFFDRPFQEGDFIVFDDFMGEIENIGVKSTRIRSLGGEQIVISNSNLTGAKIRNYKRMAQRRSTFKIGIIYETPIEKVKKVSEIIRGILNSISEIRVDRVHFKEFADFSLIFEVVYFVKSSDYNQYMDIQQQINLAIMESFEKEGIQFAYPTSVQYQRALN